MGNAGVEGDGHIVVTDQRFDQRFGLFGQIPKPVRIVAPNGLIQPDLILTLARANLPAVATRGAKADFMRLKQHDIIALLGQMQGGGKAGVTAADDADIGPHLAAQLWKGGQRRGGGCVVRRGIGPRLVVCMQEVHLTRSTANVHVPKG